MAAAVDRATLVTFTIGTDTLACPVESVERVLRFTPPARVPGMPDWLDGVIEHCGVMVPVIDLRRRFSREPVVNRSATRVVIFNVQPGRLAAVVDAVTEVATVDASTIVAPPLLVRGLSGAYLLGMVTHRGHVVPVLDIGKVLSASEVLVLEALRGTIQHPSDD